MKDGLFFLKFGKFSVQPFKWTLEYDRIIPDVRFCETHQRHYLLFSDKKLYFKKGYSLNYAQYLSRSLLKEQDIRSAHVYQTPDFQVENRKYNY